MSDPEISSIDFSEDELAKEEQTEHAPAWFECPRWGGQAQPITPRRQRAIADKRAFDRFRRSSPLRRLMSGEEFVIRLGNGGDLVGRIEWRELATAIAMSVLLACRATHRRLVLAIASAMRHGGYLGVAATHDELGKAIGKSPRQTRRVVNELVALELLLPPVPLFVRYGAASSQRGNVYRVGPLVYAAVDVARAPRPRMATPMAGHRTGAEMASHPDTYSGVLLDLPKEREALPRMAGHGPAEVEPEHFSAAVQGDTTGAAGRCTRQDASTSSVPEAPERAGLDDIAAARALLSQLIGGAA